MAYWVQTPWWVKKLYSNLIWDMPVEDKPAVYITFDDGPHPEITPFVLEQLNLHNAKATFFCIGKNVVANTEIYNSIIKDGHAIGNHTQNHLNGWKTDTAAYLENIQQAAGYINSRLFRPPYGRIKRKQALLLSKSDPAWKICMWDILSGDFDKNITPEQCLENVLKYIKPGSIIIFHDSEKAWERMKFALPKVLEHCKEKNWQLKALPA
jgi:peptidoglycan/xylan/chitin deacetylase (PgdA/CDA1 family)